MINKKLYQRIFILVFTCCLIFFLSFVTWPDSENNPLYKEEVLSKKVSLNSGEVWSGTFKEYNLAFYRPMPDEKPGPLRKRGENLPFSGSIEIIDKEASIYQKQNLENGIMEGEAQIFYEEGIIYEKGTFKKGKKEGEWTTYHYNGNIMSTEIYKNGKRHGKLTSFDNEGRFSEIISFRNGKRHGKSIQYRKGKPAYKSYYVFGKRIMTIKLES